MTEPHEREPDDGLWSPDREAARRAGADQAFGMACHLSTLATYTLRLAPFNLAGLLAPLLLWQILEQRHPRATYHAKEAFNFQLNVLGLLILAQLLGSFCCLGKPLWVVTTIANVVLPIAAAVRAAQGERYRYPGILRPIDPDR